MSTDKVRRVAVIGAGVGGLAVAACLKKLKTSVEEVMVFDPHDDLLSYNIGGLVGLSGGSAIIEQLGGLDALKHHGFPVKNIIFTSGSKDIINIDIEHTLKTDSFASKSLCDQSEEHKPLLYTIRWSALRKLLFQLVNDETSRDESPEKGDSETNVYYVTRSRFQHLREDPNTGKVSILFADGRIESNFDLVVGADGLKSTVRNYTSSGNENILNLIPFARFLLTPTMLSGNQFTGVKVTQCISPPNRSEQLNAAIRQIKENPEELVQMLDRICSGQIHQWSGNGCNAMTAMVGDRDQQYYALLLISREEDKMSSLDSAATWAPANERIQSIRETLKQAGLDQYKELLALANLCTVEGGLIFDVSIRDTFFPLRSWSSTSGRVVLVGDSAHTSSPFLGQGANQAIQDAFCLASLIYQYNRGNFPKQWQNLASKPSPSFTVDIVHFFIKSIVAIMIVITNFASALRLPAKATNMQRLASEYEKRRKLATMLVVIGSRIIGYFDTIGKPFLFIKHAFFSFLAISGLVKLFFIAPMKPVV